MRFPFFTVTSRTKNIIDTSPYIDIKNIDGVLHVQGVLEEVGLIQWPTITGALLNTALVIGIVFGTSLVLLAVNTGLAELSREIYSYKL